MAGGPKAIRADRVLYLWDFDWSMIEENSDTALVDLLGVRDVFERETGRGRQWTTVMDACFREASRRGRTERDFDAACASSALSVHPAVRAALAAAHEAGSALAVASDANAFFIERVLRHGGLGGLFSAGIFTNPAGFAAPGGEFRVRPYAGTLGALMDDEQRASGGGDPEAAREDRPAHGCPACPGNLCKGEVLGELLGGGRFDRVCYVGDGGNDVCPSLRAGSGAVALARARYPPGSAKGCGPPRPCPMLASLAAEGCEVRAAGGDPGRGGAAGPAPGGGDASALPEWLRDRWAEGGELGSGLPSVVSWDGPEELAAALRTVLALTAPAPGP